MATYKELRDAVAARVDKLNWTAYETNSTSTERERNSMQRYQYDSKTVQDFYNSYREFISCWMTENVLDVPVDNLGLPKNVLVADVMRGTPKDVPYHGSLIFACDLNTSHSWNGSELKMVGGNTQPRVVALNLDAVDVNFEKDWHRLDKMSSTYIKAPVAIAVKSVYNAMISTDQNLNNIRNTRHFGILSKLIKPESDFNYVILTSVDEVNAWFDKMEKLKDYFIRQGNEVVKIKAEIKAEGKQFKDIIKTTTDRKAKKQARQDYEDMIKRKLLRITKKEQILAIGMKED